MEDHKEAYFQKFCERPWKRKGEITPDQKKVELRQFINGCKEDIIRCYAGTIELTLKDGIDLVDIILVDACFIIELFLMNFENENHEKDYILSSPWLREAVELELILFENQLPYSLLQDLFNYAFPAASSSSNPRKECSTDDHAIDIYKAKSVIKFLELTCQFFKDYSMEKSAKGVTVKPKHFTDLVRHFMCPDGEMTWEGDSANTPIKSRYTIRKLTAAGVNFVPASERAAGFIVKSNFGSPNSMYLELTKLCIKDDTECIIRNVMALEQFLYPNKAYVCNYFLLMDKLVDTVEDVDFLIGEIVIVNMLGSSQAAANLINTLCDHIMEEKSCYTDICKELNDHYETSWNRHVIVVRKRDKHNIDASIYGKTKKINQRQ
ncbi:hypothetical protein M0R45_035001 [Rubus argutus]|uniref:Uncharacterized protein n=1 Tax=Rubus argutus TaxID=59490 RepID=A0AAW1VW05_RUBAR